MSQTKVFLVDNQEIFREGLARLLQEQPAIRLVSQCRNSEQIADKVRDAKPDVLLIDADISDLKSAESLKTIVRVSPETRIVIFTENREKSQFLNALQIGVRGYLSKNVPIDELISSLSLIARGEIVISPAFSRQFLFSVFQNQFDPVRLAERPSLSGREIEVLRLVTGGATNREIADQLFIAENTVKVHLKKMLEKLQLRNRQQLAAYAVRQGLCTASK